MATSLEQATKKGFQRRWVFEGWDNYTDFEKSYAQEIKDIMKDKYAIDVDIKKEYGPKDPKGFYYEGTRDVVSGADRDFQIADIVRYMYGRRFNKNDICTSLKNHLEWRQTFIPFPKLNDAVLTLLNSGILYLHGRAIDQSPIMILDFKNLSRLLKEKKVDNYIFCGLHNMLA